MKKTLLICVCLMAAIMVISCASSSKTKSGNTTSTSASASKSQSERKVNSIYPPSIREAKENVPEDAIVGVGTAKMATLNQSLTISQTRALADITRQLNGVVNNMIIDYTGSSEVDHSAVQSFNENVTVILARARLQGAVTVAQEKDADGNYWTAVQLSKTTAADAINQAVAAAKLREPKMATFDAQQRMYAAFDKYLKDDIGYTDK